MNKIEAEKEATRINKQPDLRAKVVRILSPEIDPVQDNDNGWDVEVTVLEPHTATGKRNWFDQQDKDNAFIDQQLNQGYPFK